MKKVFLGGTCNGSDWRQQLIPLLKIDFFNPVTYSWTAERKSEELMQRALCDICLYVITPKMTGVYSIAEAVDDSNKKPRNTALCILSEDEGATFSPHQENSLRAMGDLVWRNGAQVFSSLEAVAAFLNEMGTDKQ